MTPHHIALDNRNKDWYIHFSKIVGTVTQWLMIGGTIHGYYKKTDD
jgi:hypothetical protein